MLNLIRGERVLSIEMEFRKGILFVRLSGELTERTIEKLNSELLKRAVEDVLSNRKLLMEEQQCNMTLQQKLQQFQQAKLHTTKAAGEAFLAKNKTRQGVTVLPNGLQYEIVKAGDGPKPTEADTVVVHYTGTLIDGTEFDSSVKRGEPATFPLKGVIKGWTEILQLMPKGSKWKVYIQVMTEEQANAMENNPFDLTKMWLKKDYPLMPVGEFELNRNPDNYFAEIEQAAFAPSNIVPGISFSPDRMLQGRLFSYADAQRYRLGANYYQIPVNAAKCPVNIYHRDGQGRIDGNHGSTIGYAPNSFGEWAEQPEFKNPPLDVSGPAYQYDFYEDDSDFFTQPGKLFRLMSPEQQQALFDNTAAAMNGVPDFIKERHAKHCYQCDPAYGEGVAKALGMNIDFSDVK